jgi:hypothetical protein
VLATSVDVWRELIVVLLRHNGALWQLTQMSASSHIVSLLPRIVAHLGKSLAQLVGRVVPVLVGRTVVRQPTELSQP